MNDGVPSPADQGAVGDWADRFAREAIEFVGFEARRPNAAEIVDRFLRFVEPLDIAHVAVVDLWRTEADLMSAIRFSTYPPDAIGAYIRSRLDRSDPVLREAHRAGQFFVWSRFLPEGAGETILTRAFFSPLGIVDGFAVPIFQAHGRRSAVFLGSRRPMAGLDPVVESALAFAATAFGAYALRAAGRSGEEGVLTQREREILTWTAHGRNAREIGAILDVSDKTVAQHLLNIRTKLHSANTAQAVARAVLEKLIVI